MATRVLWAIVALVLLTGCDQPVPSSDKEDAVSAHSDAITNPGKADSPNNEGADAPSVADDSAEPTLDTTVQTIDPHVCDFAPQEGTYWDLDQNFEQLDLTVEATLEGCKLSTANFVFANMEFVGYAFPLEEPYALNSVYILDCQSPDHEAFTISTILEDGTLFSKHRFAMNP